MKLRTLALLLGITLSCCYSIALHSQEVDFIQKMDRSDIPIPYKESTGLQVDIDGEYAVISAPVGSGQQLSQAGIAIVYKYDQEQEIWNEIKTLSPSVPKDGALFGWSVAISGDVIAISELGDVTAADFEAADVYIFQKDEGGIDNWGEVKRIVSPFTTPTIFGFAIDVTDSLLVICPARGETVFIHERNAGGNDNWGLSKTIATPTSSFFNLDVDIEEDLVVFTIDNEGVFIHRKDLGGVNNWGLVKNIPEPANSSLLGIEIQDSIVILGDTRGKKIRVYKKDEGGVDNWGLVQTIQGNDNFGSGIDLRDSLVIVGESRADVNGFESGQARIYRLTSSDTAPLEEIFVLSPSSPREEDFFGIDVAIQGEYALVGASGLLETGLQNTRGRAFFFDRNVGGPHNWGEVLAVDDGINGAVSQYGSTIDTDGDFMITSAPQGTSVEANNSGLAYLYARNAGGANNWGEIKFFKSPNPVNGNQYGKQAKIDNDIAVVSEDGSINIYYQDTGGPNNWGLVKTLDQPNNFLDIDNDILVVTTGDDILVFQKDLGGADNWGLLKQLTSPPGGIAIINTVSIYEDDIMVGDPGFASAGISHIGKVYHYSRNQGSSDNWGFVESISASDERRANHFGSDLSIYQDLLVVSSKNSDSGSARQLYIFEREEDGFEEKKIIQSFATNSPNFSQFSRSVAITDRFIITGDQRENSLIGEAYVFGRNVGGASNWGLVKKVIPPDGVRRDAFSREVGITGNSIFIHSAADGSHGSNSGSVYHFEIEPREKVWTGNIDSDWNNTLNWSSEIVPINGDDVAIPLRVNQPIIDVTTAVLNSIIIERKASVQVRTNGRLNIAD